MQFIYITFFRKKKSFPVTKERVKPSLGSFSIKFISLNLNTCDGLTQGSTYSQIFTVLWIFWTLKTFNGFIFRRFLCPKLKSSALVGLDSWSVVRMDPWTLICFSLRGGYIYHYTYMGLYTGTLTFFIAEGEKRGKKEKKWINLKLNLWREVTYWKRVRKPRWFRRWSVFPCHSGFGPPADLDPRSISVSGFGPPRSKSASAYGPPFADLDPLPNFPFKHPLYHIW